MMDATSADRSEPSRDFTYYFLRFVGILNVLAFLWALTPWFPWP